MKYFIINFFSLDYLLFVESGLLRVPAAQKYQLRLFCPRAPKEKVGDWSMYACLVRVWQGLAPEDAEPLPDAWSTWEPYRSSKCVSSRANRFWKSSIVCRFVQDYFDYNIGLTLGHLLWPKPCLVEMNFISSSSWTPLIRNSFIHWLPCTIMDPLQMS